MISEEAMRVLSVLRDFPEPVGVGCFASFACLCWPEQTKGRKANRWARCAGSHLAKMGRRGLCRREYRYPAREGWVITDAGRSAIDAAQAQAKGEG